MIEPKLMSLSDRKNHPQNKSIGAAQSAKM